MSSEHVNVIVEFIAIPPDLDINNFLSVPESVGRFKSHHVKKETILLIGKSIQNSPTYTLSNATVSVIYSCLTLLNILQELDLTVSTASNIKGSNTRYKDFLESGFFDELDPRETTTNFVIVIVNLFPLMSENLIEGALTSLVKLEEFQEEINQTIKAVA